jgi:mannose-1-phosphate guanylyltransferase/mannose-6-phosphate isomerase
MHVLVQPVILSGGSGTRLWPLSREEHPKQVLHLLGATTMLQATAKRLSTCADFQVAAEPIVVCSEQHRFITAEQLREAGHCTSRIVLEPVGRNTAPALTLAALLSIGEGSDEILLVMPADHVILDEAEFARSVGQAVQHAMDGAIVTFGIFPDRPETGYGYIRVGAKSGSAFAISGFFEKPDAATAQLYLEDGGYLWNSGLFMMRASVWLAAVNLLQPEMLAACKMAMERGKRDSDFFRAEKTAFSSCTANSIDYAIMERLNTPESPPGRVLPLNAGWSDIGAWDALWQVCDKDTHGNVTRGDVLLHDAKDNLVFSSARLVACVGLNNVIVVETPDAVLVTSKDKAQCIKEIVADLKAASRSESLSHRKVHRPWGCYDSVDGGDRFKVKRISVKPGASLSLQMHHHRAEHWIIVKGTARVTRGDEVFLLSENQSTYIPLGISHRLENPGKFLLEMIEVQSGSYLGEDDIVRFEDTYGRT